MERFYFEIPGPERKEAAIDYSEKLFRDIHANLHRKVKKGAPAYFKRYGTDIFYSSFKRSKHTVWYVFYSVHSIDGETVYLVRHLTNNHIIARYLD